MTLKFNFFKDINPILHKNTEKESSNFFCVPFCGRLSLIQVQSTDLDCAMSNKPTDACCLDVLYHKVAAMTLI